MNTQLGYVMEFKGHGSFAPSGKIEMTPEEIDAHNSALATAELEAMKQTGKAVLYLFKQECGELRGPSVNGFYVGTWASKPFQRSPNRVCALMWHYPVIYVSGHDGNGVCIVQGSPISMTIPFSQALQQCKDLGGRTDVAWNGTLGQWYSL